MKDKAQRTSAFSIIFSRLKKEKKETKNLTAGKTGTFLLKFKVW